MKIEQGMTPLEIRSSLSLASIYGLRMLGMFLILPIFAIYAEGLPGSPSAFQVGLALGAYGLTQALFQLPFGMLSDRYGRKNIIYIGLLLFALGSFVSGYSDDINIIILGRAIQGAGAISAAITALVADLTRDEHRTKAMACSFGVRIDKVPQLFRDLPWSPVLGPGLRSAPDPRFVSAKSSAQDLGAVPLSFLHS